MTKEIKVIDYVMGTGKSTYLLKKLQKDSSIRYIYVAPLSSEVEDRAKDELAATEVNIPSDKEGLKSEDMLHLLKAGKNIAKYLDYKYFTKSITKILRNQVIINVSLR